MRAEGDLGAEEFSSLWLALRAADATDASAPPALLAPRLALEELATHGAFGRPHPFFEQCDLTRTGRLDLNEVAAALLITLHSVWLQTLPSLSSAVAAAEPETVCPHGHQLLSTLRIAAPADGADVWGAFSVRACAHA